MPTIWHDQAMAHQAVCPRPHVVHVPCHLKSTAIAQQVPQTLEWHHTGCNILSIFLDLWVNIPLDM